MSSASCPPTDMSPVRASFARSDYHNHMIISLAVALQYLLAGFPGDRFNGDDPLVRPQPFEHHLSHRLTAGRPKNTTSARSRRHRLRTAPRRRRYRAGSSGTNSVRDRSRSRTTCNIEDGDIWLTVVDVGDDTRVRMEQPEQSITGRHRCTLDYVFPVPRLQLRRARPRHHGPGRDDGDRTATRGVTLIHFDTTACDTVDLRRHSAGSNLVEGTTPATTSPFINPPRTEQPTSQ